MAFKGFLRQSTAVTIKLGKFVDSTDGNTEETALTINQADVRLSKNGGNIAQKNEASACTHDEGGDYDCSLDTTDTNTLGRLRVECHVSGALYVVHDYQVVTANWWDSMFSTDTLQADLTEIGGVAQRALDLAEIAQYLFANGVTLATIIANNSVMARILATAGNVTTYSETTDSLQSIRDVAPHGTAMRGTDNAEDAVWDEVLTAGTHDVGYSAGQRLRYLILDGATAQAGAAQTITLVATASATDDIYDQNIISIVGGTGAGQTRMIVEYNGTSKVATVDRPWTTQPAADSIYELLPSVGEVLATHGIAQAATASTITLATNALAIADSYVGSDIYVTGGTGIGQTRLITAYTVGRVATISPDWDTTPDATSIYKVLPIGRSITDSMSTAAVTALKTEMEASGSLLDWLRDVAEGDAKIEGTNPFTFKVYRKDTAEVLISKSLYQKDSTAVSSTDHVVGQQLETAL
jgi:hypothetical protein